MNAQLIALAIPVFFALIGLELWWTHRIKGWHEYRLADAITDLSCGVGQQALGLFIGIGLFAVYDFVFRQWSLVQLAPDGAAAWVVAFVGVDFLYYWWHRLSHEVNLLWAVHVVHHHSQDYNLAVALRQAWFSGVTSMIFYLPLAFIGVPPAVFFPMVALSTLYQFWIHTRVVRTMGVFEGVLNTPSAHRVHHGINPQYIDRNHGAIFIVWDRLFGTYEREGQDVVYGVVAPHQSWNPVWANFESFAKVWRLSVAAPRLVDKVQVWFRPPGWKPLGLGPHEVPPPVDASRFVKWDTPRGRSLSWYVAFHYVPVVAGTFCALWFGSEIPTGALAALVALLVWSTFAFGALFEDRAYAVAAEVLRLAGGAAVAVYFLGVIGGALALATLVTAGCVLSMVVFWRVRVRDHRTPSP